MLTISQKIFYRKEYERLLFSKDLKTIIESHKLISDLGFVISYKHSLLGAKSVWDHEANILFQMSVLKSISLQHLAHSINYRNDIDGTFIKDLYDPYGMLNLVRAQYEAYCNFNNIFIQSNAEEDLKLKYDIWVLSGLSYRQRFNAESEEQIKTKEYEANQIIQLKNKIVTNECYKQLEEKSQLNIQECINRREWQIKIHGKKAYKIGWHDMMTNAGIGKHNLTESLYSYLSLATHPSNVSVFQFSSMYINEKQEFNVEMALELSQSFISMMIRDYVIYFNLKENIFDKLPLIPQMLINSNNIMYRGDEYKLNEVGNQLS